MQNKFLRSELTKGSSFSCLFFNLALFSFQDAVFAVLRGFILSRRLIYYTTFSEVCQVFFQSFLKNFFRSCRIQNYSPLYLSVSLQAFLLYHVFGSLSRGFSEVFSNSFVSFSPILRFLLPLPRSATPVRLGSELVYYTTFSVPCQVLFQNFF